MGNGQIRLLDRRWSCISGKFCGWRDTRHLRK
jgi:hypothetical protein